jgi:hypothetical protein
MSIKKCQSAECLILRGCSNIFCRGQVNEKSFDFWNSHIFKMLLVMKQDVTSNPLNIGLLCAIGIMLQPDGITDSIEEFPRWAFHGKQNKLTTGLVKILYCYSEEMDRVLG